MHFHTPVDSNLIDSVVSLDSILVGEYYYKVWTMVELDTEYVHGFTGWRKVNTFIEGVGNLFSPANRTVLDPGCTELLRCFKHADAVVDFSAYYFCPNYGDTLHYVNECATLGVKDYFVKKSTDVQIFPNPAATQITIKSAGSGNAFFTRTNIVGQPMMAGKLNDNETMLKIDALPKGFYFLAFKSAGGEVVKKLLKE